MKHCYQRDYSPVLIFRTERNSFRWKTLRKFWQKRCYHASKYKTKSGKFFHELDSLRLYRQNQNRLLSPYNLETFFFRDCKIYFLYSRNKIYFSHRISRTKVLKVFFSFGKYFFSMIPIKSNF